MGDNGWWSADRQHWSKAGDHVVWWGHPDQQCYASSELVEALIPVEHHREWWQLSMSLSCAERITSGWLSSTETNAGRDHQVRTAAGGAVGECHGQQCQMLLADEKRRDVSFIHRLKDVWQNRQNGDLGRVVTLVCRLKIKQKILWQQTVGPVEWQAPQADLIP
jgi:hypothetical protein